MYTLYYFPGNASLTPHMVLREIGVPFELRLVDRANNAQKHPDYLALNPNGLIPVLTFDKTSIYETAAIAMFLADRHLEAGLAPHPQSPERGEYYKWMFYISNALQSGFRAWFYPHEFTADAEGVESVKRAIAGQLSLTFGRIGKHLSDNQWLLGRQFSVADLYLFMFVRWGRGLPTPPRSISSLADHAKRVTERTAVRAALAYEGITKPFV